MALQLLHMKPAMQSRHIRLLTWVLCGFMVAGCGAMAARADAIPSSVVTWNLAFPLANGGNMSGFITLDFFNVVGGGFVVQPDNTNFSVNVVMPDNGFGTFDFTPENGSYVFITGDPLIHVFNNDPGSVTFNVDPFTNGQPPTVISGTLNFSNNNGQSLTTSIATPEPPALALLGSGLLLLGLAYHVRRHAV